MVKAAGVVDRVASVGDEPYFVRQDDQEMAQNDGAPWPVWVGRADIEHLSRMRWVLLQLKRRIGR